MKNKKLYIVIVLVLTLALSTTVFASLTFTTDAITGTTVSTIDLGVGNNLLLQTSGGNIGIGMTGPTATLDIVGANGTDGDAPLALRVVGGIGCGSGNTSGSIDLTAGMGGSVFGGGSAIGGSINLTAGEGGASGIGSGSSAVGGNINIIGGTGGNGMSVYSKGGDVYILGGLGGGTGRFSAPAGNVLLGIDSGSNLQGYVGIGTIAPTQELEINGGMRLNTVTDKPTCDNTVRGTFWTAQGGTGVKDTVEVCAKDGADAYDWRTLY
jgi:hypothetical protein